MDSIRKTGRYLFSIVMIGFGVIHFSTGNFPIAFFPIQSVWPGRQLAAYIAGIIFCGAGIGILINKVSKLAVIIAGVLFFILFLFPHLMKLISNVKDPREWTVAFEILAISSGAFILAGSLPADGKYNYKWFDITDRIAKYDKYPFAVSLIVFGVLHYLYAEFIATLIPAWMPFHIFWSYVVMVGFIATGVSILINIQTRLAAALFGIMFFIMVLVLHAPRALARPEMEAEWTSLFIAMAMCGSGFILADSLVNREKHTALDLPHSV